MGQHPIFDTSLKEPNLFKSELKFYTIPLVLRCLVLVAPILQSHHLHTLKLNSDALESNHRVVAPSLEECHEDQSPIVRNWKFLKTCY